MSLASRDLAHIWHPCSQMKDYETFPPLEIIKARGSHLTLASGQELIDAVSSWWCKSLGHNHPRLNAALVHQLEQFEHVIHANTTNRVTVELAERLAALTPHLDKVFFAGDGSCAVEVAMKMSIHARHIQGQSEKTHFIALENGYHGETLATLSVSDCGIYKAAYQSQLTDHPMLRGIPYVSGIDDPLWSDCSALWPAIETQLEQFREQATAIILEPLVQGAGGMLIYSADFLQRLAAWAKANNVHLILDEIMTGFGRTGKMLASDYCNIEADFICLSKGLSSGYLPISAVLTHDGIYDLCYDDYNKGKSFLHSHTYSGNALAASVALETLKVFEDENIIEQTQTLSKAMGERFKQVSEHTGCVTNIRQLGAVIAGDIHSDSNHEPRLGYQVFRDAVANGAWLRPLGNTLYWFPPLNTSIDTLDDLADITEASIRRVCRI